MLENRSNTTASEAVDLSASRDGLGPIYKRYVLAISRLNSHLKLLKYDPSSDAQVCAPFFVRGVGRSAPGPVGRPSDCDNVGLPAVGVNVMSYGSLIGCSTLSTSTSRTARSSSPKCCSRSARYATPSRSSRRQRNAPAPPVLGLSPDMHARAFPARTRQNERA